MIPPPTVEIDGRPRTVRRIELVDEVISPFCLRRLYLGWARAGGRRHQVRAEGLEDPRLLTWTPTGISALKTPRRATPGLPCSHIRAQVRAGSFNDVDFVKSHGELWFFEWGAADCWAWRCDQCARSDWMKGSDARRWLRRNLEVGP